jgi:hypothetical protein
LAGFFICLATASWWLWQWRGQSYLPGTGRDNSSCLNFVSLADGIAARLSVVPGPWKKRWCPSRPGIPGILTRSDSQLHRLGCNEASLAWIAGGRSGCFSPFLGGVFVSLHFGPRGIGGRPLVCAAWQMLWCNICGLRRHLVAGLPGLLGGSTAWRLCA